MTGSASGSGIRGWKERGKWRAAGLAPLAEASSCLGLFLGAEEGREREGEWWGTGAYAANGGMLILELYDGARSGVRPGLWMVLRC